MSNGQCEDINECNKNNICPAHSICANTAGSFSCTCLEGFADNDGECVDIDECAIGMFFNKAIKT